MNEDYDVTQITDRRTSGAITFGRQGSMRTGGVPPLLHGRSGAKDATSSLTPFTVSNIWRLYGAQRMDGTPKAESEDV